MSKTLANGKPESQCKFVLAGGCGSPVPYQPTPRPARDVPSVVGVPTIVRADLSYDGQKKKAVPGQTLNLDAMIQAAKESTDIAAIVARAKMGDESVLHVNPGFVGDAASLPKDIYDYKAMNDLYDRVSGSFETLPDGVKALFDNSSEKYLDALLNNTANSIVAAYNAQQANQNQESEGNQ